MSLIPEIIVVTTNPLLLRKLQGEVVTVTNRYAIVLLPTLAQLTLRLHTHHAALVLIDANVLATHQAADTLRDVVQIRPGMSVLLLKRQLITSYVHVLSAVSIGHVAPVAEAREDVLAPALDEAQLVQEVLRLLAEKRVAEKQYLLEATDLHFLRLLAQGKTLQQIGQVLSTTERTVYRKRKRLWAIFNVETDGALIKRADDLGLLDE